MVILPGKNNNQRGFIEIISAITLTVLLVGVAVSSYLAGQRQDIRNRAAYPDTNATSNLNIIPTGGEETTNTVVNQTTNTTENTTANVTMNTTNTTENITTNTTIADSTNITGNTTINISTDITNNQTINTTGDTTIKTDVTSNNTNDIVVNQTADQTTNKTENATTDLKEDDSEAKRIKANQDWWKRQQEEADRKREAAEVAAREQAARDKIAEEEERIREEQQQEKERISLEQAQEAENKRLADISAANARRLEEEADRQKKQDEEVRIQAVKDKQALEEERLREELARQEEEKKRIVDEKAREIAQRDFFNQAEIEEKLLAQKVAQEVKSTTQTSSQPSSESISRQLASGGSSEDTTLSDDKENETGLNTLDWWMQQEEAERERQQRETQKLTMDKAQKQREAEAEQKRLSDLAQANAQRQAKEEEADRKAAELATRDAAQGDEAKREAARIAEEMVRQADIEASQKERDGKEAEAERQRLSGIAADNARRQQKEAERQQRQEDEAIRKAAEIAAISNTTKYTELNEYGLSFPIVDSNTQVPNTSQAATKNIDWSFVSAGRNDLGTKITSNLNHAFNPDESHSDFGSRAFALTDTLLLGGLSNYLLTNIEQNAQGTDWNNPERVKAAIQLGGTAVTEMGVGGAALAYVLPALGIGTAPALSTSILPALSDAALAAYVKGSIVLASAPPAVQTAIQLAGPAGMAVTAYECSQGNQEACAAGFAMGSQYLGELAATNYSNITSLQRSRSLTYTSDALSGTTFAENAQLSVVNNTYVSDTGTKRIIIDPSNDIPLRDFLAEGEDYIRQKNRINNTISQVKSAQKFVFDKFPRYSGVTDISIANQVLAEQKAIYNSQRGTANLGQFIQGACASCREQSISLHTLLGTVGKESEVVTGETGVKVVGKHAWVEFIDSITGKRMVADSVWGFVKPAEEAYRTYGGVRNIQQQIFVKP